MDFKIDFTNFQDHPTNRSYMVFKFHRKEQADYFEGLLHEAAIHYERHDDNENPEKIRYLFAAPKKHEDQLRYLNNLAIGKFRNKFIPDRGFRIFVFIISALVLGLAIIGYLRAA